MFFYLDEGFISVAILDMIHTSGLVGATIIWVIDVYNRRNWSGTFIETEYKALAYFYVAIGCLTIVLLYTIIMTLQILDPIVLLLLREVEGDCDDLRRIRRYRGIYFVAQGFAVIMFGFCIFQNLIDGFNGFENTFPWDWLGIWFLVRGLIFSFGQKFCKCVFDRTSVNFRNSGRPYHDWERRERESRV